MCGTVGGSDEGRSKTERLGYIPEVPSVYELLTVWEHMEFIARAYRLADWRGDAEALLARYALSGKRDALGSQLSKGMRQKLLIACAVLHRPQLFLFDEPVVGLDPQAQRELHDEMLRLKAAGGTLLGSVERVADRAVIMTNGTLLGAGTLDELREQYALPLHTPLEDVFLHATLGADEKEAGAAGEQ